MKIEAIVDSSISEGKITPAELRVGQALKFESTGNIVVRVLDNSYLKIWKFGNDPQFLSLATVGGDKGVLLPKGTTFDIKITI